MQRERKDEFIDSEPGLCEDSKGEMVVEDYGKIRDINDTNVIAVDNINNFVEESQLKMQSVEKTEDVVIFV